jgi:TetR/AcrR family transcriptional regulator, transcriptional repressor for nem operon
MDTKEQILNSARKLLQQRGFNGFSYADIANEVGVRKASLHHHFASKADLGVALIEGYTAAFDESLAEIAARKSSPKSRLTAYVALYRDTLEQDRLCLCGMLASDASTLDPAMLAPLRRFFERNTEWLSAQMNLGKANGALEFSGAAIDQARIFLATLQGALLIARGASDVQIFDRSTSALMQQLSRRS